MLAPDEIKEIWPQISLVVGKVVYEHILKKGCIVCTKAILDVDTRMCSSCKSKTKTKTKKVNEASFYLTVDEVEEKFSVELKLHNYFDVKKLLDELPGDDNMDEEIDIVESQYRDTARNLYHFSLMKIRNDLLALDEYDSVVDETLLLWRTRYENMKKKRHYFNQIITPFIPPLCAKILKRKTDELDQLRQFVEGEVVNYSLLPDIQNVVVEDKQEEEQDGDNEDGEDGYDEIYSLSVRTEMRNMYLKNIEKIEKKYEDEFERIYKIQKELDKEHPLLQEQCHYLLEQARVMKLKEEIEIKTNFINYLSKKELRELKKYLNTPSLITQMIEELCSQYYSLKNKLEIKGCPEHLFITFDTI